MVDIARVSQGVFTTVVMVGVHQEPHNVLSDLAYVVAPSMPSLLISCKAHKTPPEKVLILPQSGSESGRLKGSETSGTDTAAAAGARTWWSRIPSTASDDGDAADNAGGSTVPAVRASAADVDVEASGSAPSAGSALTGHSSPLRVGEPTGIIQRHHSSPNTEQMFPCSPRSHLDVVLPARSPRCSQYSIVVMFEDKSQQWKPKNGVRMTASSDDKKAPCAIMKVHPADNGP